MKLTMPLLLLGCFMGSNLFAATIQLDSYSIEKRPLPTPMVALDAAGNTRTFDVEYLVKVKGAVPTTRALPVYMFIGDYPIREYGATADGIYFRVTDPQVLRQMHGKPFRYAVNAQAVRQTPLIFRAPTE
jgi:hypothetical protein